MKWIVSILPVIACTLLFAAGKKSLVDRSGYYPPLLNESAENKFWFTLFIPDRIANTPDYSLKELDIIVKENKIAQFFLGHTRQGRKIDAYYFPGTSGLRALVIAGVHGSELSSIEVAYQLLSQLLGNGQPYYSVIVIPSLFPDNAMKALDYPGKIGSTANTGRYTYDDAVDPNRQMPSPGMAYDENHATDHSGREIEKENQLLLELIQSFKPQRIANIHAIRDVNYGGVYADPRTDHNGLALGYSSDSSLAIQIARFIHRQGGNVAGNRLDKKATALYYKDPPPAPKGFFQKRNMTGIVPNTKRGSGVSFGTWGSTAIANQEDATRNRDAIRIITIEYPGYKRPVDYTTTAGQAFQQKQVGLFASAISTIFLGKYFEEGVSNDHQPDEKESL